MLQKERNEICCSFEKRIREMIVPFFAWPIASFRFFFLFNYYSIRSFALKMQEVGPLCGNLISKELYRSINIFFVCYILDNKLINLNSNASLGLLCK